MTKFMELFPDDVSEITLEHYFYTDSDGEIQMDENIEGQDWRFFNKHGIDITRRCMINGHLQDFVDEKGNNIVDKIVNIIEDNVPAISNVISITGYSVILTIKPKSKLVTFSIDTSYTAEDSEGEDDSKELDLPQDLWNLPWSELKGGKINIEYSGSGDDGGITDIFVSGIKDGIKIDGQSISERLKSWMWDKADELIPSDANFNNEGSQGHIECRITKHDDDIWNKTIPYILDCQIHHSNNYEDSVSTELPHNPSHDSNGPMWKVINFEIDKDKSHSVFIDVAIKHHENWRQDHGVE